MNAFFDFNFILCLLPLQLSLLLFICLSYIYYLLSMGPAPQSLIWNAWGQLCFEIEVFFGFKKRMQCTSSIFYKALQHLRHHSVKCVNISTENIYTFTLSGKNTNCKWLHVGSRWMYATQWVHVRSGFSPSKLLKYLRFQSFWNSGIEDRGINLMFWRNPQCYWVRIFTLLLVHGAWWGLVNVEYC